MCLCHFTNSKRVTNGNHNLNNLESNSRKAKKKFVIEHFFLPEDQAFFEFAKRFRFKFEITGRIGSENISVLKINGSYR